MDLVSTVCARIVCMMKKEIGELDWRNVQLVKEKTCFH